MILLSVSGCCYCQLADVVIVSQWMLLLSVSGCCYCQLVDVVIAS